MEQNSIEVLNEKLVRSIKERNLKYTVQREMILEVLFENSGHFTPEEIKELVDKKHENSALGIATMYRTLNFFEEVGLVASISFGQDGKKYEISKCTHHDHIVCTKCGLIEEFFHPQIENIQSQIAKSHGFTLEAHQMQLFGLCPKCQSSK